LGNQPSLGAAPFGSGHFDGNPRIQMVHWILQKIDISCQKTKNNAILLTFSLVLDIFRKFLNKR
jgi:hypothetical protein